MKKVMQMLKGHYNFTINTELNDLRIITWEILKFLLKEFQFVMSLKNLQGMANTVCLVDISDIVGYHRYVTIHK